MAYQYDEGALFGGMTTLDLVDGVLRSLGFAPADYNRYTKANIVRALNQAQNQFCFKTGCLTAPVIVVCMASRQTYRLPSVILRVLSAQYFSGDDTTSYEELELFDSPERMQRLDSTYRGSTGDPCYLFNSYRAGAEIQFGVSPIPTSDGTAFTAATFGVIESSEGWQFAGAVTGAHKTGSSATAYCTDNAGRDVTTLGLMPGQMIYNTTQGEVAMISKIANVLATNDGIHGTLTHSKTWTAQDAYVVYLSEFALVCSPKLNKVSTVQSFYGTVSDITPKTGNLLLQCVRRPLPLTSAIDAFVCEIPPEYENGIIGYAVWQLGKGTHKGSRQLDKAKEGLALFNAAVEEYKATSQVESSENAIESYDYLD